MGEESLGMILAAEDENGGLKILEADQNVKTGTRVK